MSSDVFKQRLANKASVETLRGCFVRAWATRKRDRGRVKSEFLFRVEILSNLKLAVECRAGFSEASSARCTVSS
eukprot:11201889-Lingulodinium_polyedra.AAC.1